MDSRFGLIRIELLARQILANCITKATREMNRRRLIGPVGGAYTSWH